MKNVITSLEARITSASSFPPHRPTSSWYVGLFIIKWRYTGYSFDYLTSLNVEINFKGFLMFQASVGQIPKSALFNQSMKDSHNKGEDYD